VFIPQLHVSHVCFLHGHLNMPRKREAEIETPPSSVLSVDGIVDIRINLAHRGVVGRHCDWIILGLWCTASDTPLQARLVGEFAKLAPRAR